MNARILPAYKQVMIVDNKAGDKFMIFDFTRDGALLEKRGNWTNVRVKMAWNLARKTLNNNS